MRLKLQIAVFFFACIGCSTQTPIDVTFQAYQRDSLLGDLLEGQLLRTTQDSSIVFEYSFQDSHSEKYKIDMDKEILYHYVSRGDDTYEEDPYFIYVLERKEQLADKEFGTFWIISLADQNKTPISGKRGLICSAYGLIFLEQNEATEGHILSSIGKRKIEDQQKIEWYLK